MDLLFVTIALVAANVALVFLTALYVSQTQKLVESSERATKAAEASARGAEDSVRAMEEQVALQQDQLRYYYEPGLALQVHEYSREHGKPALLVKAFLASQTSVFRVSVAWKGAEADQANMLLSGGETLPWEWAQMPGIWTNDACDAWTCARVAPGQVAWCTLTDRPRGTLLVVTWEHIAGWYWRHSWTLTGEVEDQARGLTPNGVPQRIPQGSGSEDPRAA